MLGFSESGSVKFRLLRGETLKEPWKDEAVLAFESLEVTHSDTAPSGFQVQLALEPRHAIALRDSRVVDQEYFREFQRLGFEITLGLTSVMLMDGLLTHIQYSPPMGGAPGSLSLTGEDHSLTLARHKTQRRFRPDQTLSSVVMDLLKPLDEFGITADLGSLPTDPSSPSPSHGFTMVGTERDYLHRLAGLVGFRFFLVPGSEPGSGKARFVPPALTEEPQGILFIKPSGESNLEALDFTFDATQRLEVQGTADVIGKIEASAVTGVPAKATRIGSAPPDAWAKFGRIEQPQVFATPLAGQEAEAMASASALKVLEAKGTLDTASYGKLLEPGRMVMLEGVGQAFGGRYYVRQVTHRIRRGEYKQDFVICRDTLNNSK